MNEAYGSSVAVGGVSVGNGGKKLPSARLPAELMPQSADLWLPNWQASCFDEEEEVDLFCCGAGAVKYSRVAPSCGLNIPSSKEDKSDEEKRPGDGLNEEKGSPPKC